MGANTVFLNEMCTHIVDFHDRKLRQFKATKGEVLTKYVEMYPEKSSYFELSDKNEKWVFPIPGSLEGVKSRGRTIMKMSDVTFKSTAIKLLIGELKPESGQVWR